MGLYDRDYYRDESPSLWNRWGGHQLSLGLMLAVGLIFLFQVLSSPPRVEDSWLKTGALVPERVAAGEVWRLFSFPLIHPRSALLAIAYTLLNLYFFGFRMESQWGTPRLAQYLIASLGAVGLCHVGLGLLMPQFADQPIFGFTPALLTLLLLYAWDCEGETVWMIVEMPGRVLAGIVGLLMIFNGLQFGFPGALALVVVPLLVTTLLRATEALGQPNLPYTPFWVGLWPGSRRSRASSLRVIRSEESRSESRTRSSEASSSRPALRVAETADAEPASQAKTSPIQVLDEHLEAKMDQLLDKISQQGRSSLTPEEEAILQEVGQRLKSRRTQPKPG